MRKYIPWNSWITWVLFIILIRLIIFLVVPNIPNVQETYINQLLTVWQENKDNAQIQSLTQETIREFSKQSKENRYYIEKWLKEHNQQFFENPIDQLEHIIQKYNSVNWKMFQSLSLILCIFCFLLCLFSYIIVYCLAGIKGLKKYLGMHWGLSFILFILLPLVCIPCYFYFNNILYVHIIILFFTALFFFIVQQKKVLCDLFCVQQSKIRYIFLFIVCILIVSLYPYYASENMDSVVIDTKEVITTLHQLEKDHSQELVPLLLQLLSKNLSSEITINILELLSQKATIDIMPALLPYLHHKDSNIQIQTLRTISSILHKKNLEK